MNLGFKTIFLPKILHGTKKHTIREDPKSRWRPGMKIHMVVNMRTSQQRCFHKAECKSIQRIQIRYNQGKMTIYVDGVKLPRDQVFELIKNDGFDTTKEFLQWFHSDFDGKIIHWTNLKY